MLAQDDREQTLFAKIRDLPIDRVAEVEDFVDFLRSREERRALPEAATLVSEASLSAVWDNPDDDVYNDL
jgi:erythromycin esterase-like protein